MEDRTWLALVLVLLLCMWKVAKGQSDDCQPKFVDVGEDLELHCGCEFDPDVDNVEWFKKEGQSYVPVQSTSVTDDERNIKFENVTDSVGGSYKCTCGSSSECFNVYVKVHIVNFDAQPAVVRVNESFTLTCIAIGFPPPELTDFRLTKSDNHRIELTELMSLENGVYHRVEARNEDYDGKYSCLVDKAESKSTDVAGTEVTVYEPPRVVEVKNFTFSDAVSQHTAVLDCVAENRTTTASVQWSRSIDHSVITPSEKYRTDVIKKDERVEFLLIVRNLTESDIGEYLCGLSSEYNDTEGSAPVFIRNSSVPLPPEETPEVPVPADEEDDSDTTCTIVGYVCLVIIIIAFGVVVGLVIYYCKKHQGAGSTEPSSTSGVSPNGNAPGISSAQSASSLSSCYQPPSSLPSSHPSQVSLDFDSESAYVSLGSQHTTEFQEQPDRKGLRNSDEVRRRGSHM